MIHFTNLSFTYPGAEQPALDNVNLDVPAGDFALLVGPSGAGKSTLLRCLNGLTPHFSGGLITGEVRVAGMDPVAASPAGMSTHVGFVFQDPEAQFVLDRVEDEIAFALENAAMAPQEMRIRVEETLDLLDLAHLRDRPLTDLSGGEKQRVAIAAALALRPPILVLDEPTSQLDPKSAEDVLTALVRLNADLGLTIVLAEHRLERVLPFVDTLLYLPAQGAVLSGDPRDVLAQTALGPPLIRLGKTKGWTPLPLTIKEGLRFVRAEERSGRAAETAVGERSLGATELTVQNVEGGYGRNAVLKGVSLTLRGGEVTALMGRNGAGKTTLLRSIAGLTRPARGHILLDGDEITQKPVAEICRRIGYLPQNPDNLLFAETVGEELDITLRNHGLHPGQGGAPPVEPMALLTRLGLARKADAYPRDLSIGERQRAALAALLVTKPEVLLLDEPTRGLDYAAKDALTALLRGWRDEGLAIMVVTHDVELAAQLADRVIIMSQGEIIADGPPAQVMGASPLFAPQVARLYPDTGWLTVEDVLGAENQK
ncbi:MAG: ABC transporter ATP-binding protein [Caldilineaceae bacterium]|nr:ABC transporter ATP-binding protein [Caldilineaceae bacterium]